MSTSGHRKMSALMIATVAAAFCASLLSAETIIVASGESLTLDASTNNKAGNQITLNDGATLVAPLPTGNGDGYRIQANIYVAGAARLDLASTPESAYYLRIVGGLVASNDTCSLTVGGGLTQVFFGAQAGDGIINNSTAAVDGNGVHYPIINLKNLNFDATQSGSFTFRANSASTVVQVPTTCRVGFASGGLATLAMKGEDVFAQLGQTAPYSPTNFNAVVLDKAAIPAGTLVKVPAGRTMAVKPCNVNGWTWGGVEQEVNFNVELEGGRLASPVPLCQFRLDSLRRRHNRQGQGLCARRKQLQREPRPVQRRHRLQGRTSDILRRRCAIRAGRRMALACKALV